MGLAPALAPGASRPGPVGSAGSFTRGPIPLGQMYSQMGPKRTRSRSTEEPDAITGIESVGVARLG